MSLKTLDCVFWLTKSSSFHAAIFTKTKHDVCLLCVRWGRLQPVLDVISGRLMPVEALYLVLSVFVISSGCSVMNYGCKAVFFWGGCKRGVKAACCRPWWWWTVSQCKADGQACAYARVDRGVCCVCCCTGSLLLWAAELASALSSAVDRLQNLKAVIIQPLSGCVGATPK